MVMIGGIGPNWLTDHMDIQQCIVKNIGDSSGAFRE